VLAPEAGGVNASLESLAMLVIGGSGSLFGPLLGAGAIQWLFAISGRADRYELLVYGLAFFCVVLYAPSGIAGALRAAWRRVTDSLVRKIPPKAVSTASAELKITDTGVQRAGICLQVENVAKNFGGLRAVQDVSFDVSFGQIVALIGPNGAGKSTLFNIISGIETPTQGRVVLRGEDMLGVPIHRRAVAIGRSFQVPRLVPDLTVLENVVARLDHLPDAPGERAAQGIARAQLESFGLSHFADVPTRQIGLGHHKLIELVRASAGGPALLLLDEPAVGLTAEEVTRLGDLLRILKLQGAAILVVEHNIGFVSTIADEIVVMETGRLIARDKPEAVMADPHVREVYLGALA
jgi:branched-chain amino acid transport system permease protein